jgi:DnaJ-class molecular chaperone
MTVPKGSDTGTVLRLKGRGIAAGGRHGDQLVTLKIQLGTTPDDELEKFLQEWGPRHKQDPRRAMVES